MGKEFCKNCGTVIVMHWDETWYHFLSGRVPCETTTTAEPGGVIEEKDVENVWGSEHMVFYPPYDR